RIAIQWPAVGALSILQQIRPGNDVARPVADNADFLRPIRPGNTADAHEKPPRLANLLFFRRDVPNGDGVEHPIAVNSGDDRVVQYFDICSGVNPIDQAAVINPGRADRGLRNDLRSIGEMADRLAGKELALDSFTSDQNVRAEFASLIAGALG